MTNNMEAMRASASQNQVNDTTAKVFNAAKSAGVQATKTTLWAIKAMAAGQKKDYILSRVDGVLYNAVALNY